MPVRQVVGLIGSLLLVLGVFMPIVSVPILSQMNYFQNGRGDGTIVLVLGLASVVAVLARRYGALWLTGGASLVVMAITFVNFQSRLSRARTDMESQLAGNPFRGIADAAMQAVQLQWGWAVLVLGAILVLASAGMKDEIGKPNAA